MHSAAAVTRHTTPAACAAHTGNGLAGKCRLLAAHPTACKHQVLASTRQHTGCSITPLSRPIIAVTTHATQPHNTGPTSGPTVVSILPPCETTSQPGWQSPATPCNFLPTQPSEAFSAWSPHTTAQHARSLQCTPVTWCKPSLSWHAGATHSVLTCTQCHPGVWVCCAHFHLGHNGCGRLNKPTHQKREKHTYSSHDASCSKAATVS
jgi:hypothetical protein